MATSTTTPKPLLVILPLALLGIWLATVGVIVFCFDWNPKNAISPGYEKLECQKGYKGPLLPEIKEAEQACADQPVLECFYSCKARKLGVLSATDFDAHLMTNYLKRQLSASDGRDNVVRISTGYNACLNKYKSSIPEHCTKQKELWDCMEKVLDCNA